MTRTGVEREQGRRRGLAEDVLVVSGTEGEEQLAELVGAAGVGGADRQVHAHVLQRLVIGPVTALCIGLCLVENDWFRYVGGVDPLRLLPDLFGDHRETELLLGFAGDPDDVTQLVLN